MSSFLLPTTIGDGVKKMTNSFWWGVESTEWEWNKLAKTGEYGYEKGIWRYGISTYVWI